MTVSVKHTSEPFICWGVANPIMTVSVKATAQSSIMQGWGAPLMAVCAARPETARLLALELANTGTKLRRSQKQHHQQSEEDST